MTGAVSIAEEALSRCSHIDSPCSFQLAPLLVIRLIQFVQQQEMRAAIEDGLRQTAEFQAHLLRSVQERTVHEKEERHAGAALDRPSQSTQKTKKALSLLDIARGSRITSVANTVE